jgi:hypothetical protein
MEDTEFQIAPEVYEEILRGTDRKHYVKQEDRILRKTMVQLVKSGHATFLFIRDDESRAYWSKIVKDAADKVAKRKEAWDKYHLKMNAWNRLSEADRKTLKLREPTEPKI